MRDRTIEEGGDKMKPEYDFSNASPNRYYEELLGKGAAPMATIDVDALRAYMRDYFGTVMFSGFPAAIIDLSDIDSMSGHELCEKAEDMGVDLLQFVVDDEE